VIASIAPKSAATPGALVRGAVVEADVVAQRERVPLRAVLDLPLRREQRLDVQRVVEEDDGVEHVADDLERRGT